MDCGVSLYSVATAAYRALETETRAVATFEATEAAASVVFRTVASVKAIGLLLRPFLANVSEFTFAMCYIAFARPSVVCNVRAPYSGGSNFRQYFYGIRYLGHKIIPGEPLRRGSYTHKRGSQV